MHQETLKYQQRDQLVRLCGLALRQCLDPYYHRMILYYLTLHMDANTSFFHYCQVPLKQSVHLQRTSENIDESTYRLDWLVTHKIFQYAVGKYKKRYLWIIV